MASVMSHGDGSHAGLLPSQTTVGDSQDSAQRSFNHAHEAIAAAIQAYHIGLQQATYARLNDGQKAQLRVFGDDVRCAVKTTRESMVQVIGFTRLQSEIRDEVASCLRAPVSVWNDQRGSGKATALLSLLKHLKDNRLFNCVAAMEESNKKWRHVQDRQGELIRSLDSESSCLTRIIAVNAGRALATFGLGRVNRYYVNREQRLQERREPAKLRRDAAVKAKKALEEFAQVVRNDKDFHDGFDLEEMNNNNEATMEDAQKLWRRFKLQSEDVEDIIKLCQEANTFPTVMKEGLVVLFEAEAGKFRRLSKKSRAWLESIGKIVESIAKLPIPLPETPPPSDMPAELGMASE